MSEAANSPPKSPEPTVPAAVLTVAGIAAAFGVASCCALPVILYGLGIGSAGLLGVAMLAGPHRTFLLLAGAACLLGGAALVLFSRNFAGECTPGARRSRLVARAATVSGILFGSTLLVLGYIYV